MASREARVSRFVTESCYPLRQGFDGTEIEVLDMREKMGRRGFLRLLATLALGLWNPARASGKSGRWRCTRQDCTPYIYDPSAGADNIADPEHRIPPGVAFEDLPDDWVCPVCGAHKARFIELST